MILNIDYCKRFILPLGATTSSFGLEISKNAQKFYFKEIKPIEKDLYHNFIDLAPLNEEDLHQILIDQSNIYQKQISEEVEKMIRISNENKLADRMLNISKSQIINLLDQNQNNNLSLDNVQLLKN